MASRRTAYIELSPDVVEYIEELEEQAGVPISTKHVAQALIKKGLERVREERSGVRKVPAKQPRPGAKKRP